VGADGSTDDGSEHDPKSGAGVSRVIKL